MDLKEQLSTRSGNACELCKKATNLAVYAVAPSEGIAADSILVCETCASQLQHPDQADPDHWRCLNDSMWSEVPAVQVVAYRMLHHLKNEGWPQDLLDTLYLDDDTLKWALAEQTESDSESAVVHKDSNGAILNAGDTVVIIKDLDVKGTSFTAKRGTAVRNISLVADHPDQIEGRVNGQQIVILTRFVKKQ